MINSVRFNAIPQSKPVFGVKHTDGQLETIRTTKRDLQVVQKSTLALEHKATAMEERLKAMEEALTLKSKKTNPLESRVNELEAFRKAQGFYNRKIKKSESRVTGLPSLEGLGHPPQ